MLETITSGTLTLALIIYNDSSRNGTHFFTPNDYPLQVGSICRNAGDVIEPHTHRQENNTIYQYQEVLIIKKGSVKVFLYDDQHNPIATRIINEGDIIILISGGHGFEFLSVTEMIEIKQGPYLVYEKKVISPGLNSSPVVS